MLDRRKKNCMLCGKSFDPEIEFTDQLSRKEFKISKLCQECQDYISGEYDIDFEE